MKPLQIFAEIDSAPVHVEPKFLSIRSNGAIVAVSSCVLRADTANGPLYFVPEADVEMSMLREHAQIHDRAGGRSWKLWRSRDGDGRIIAVSLAARPASGDDLFVGRIGFTRDAINGGHA